ncbi:TPA: hypothetical protein N0F65_011458 [Lagenidium giganteum]|uniref:Transmembrane protein n=1 Tax=Lagenidium giganteum TaxID=4803 RepID=A0AAV2ZDB9_9STRA|nr:TPA: hypothetical protein N0F65_011458 [Lagenidium giganteum]
MLPAGPTGSQLPERASTLQLALFWLQSAFTFTCRVIIVIVVVVDIGTLAAQRITSTLNATQDKAIQVLLDVLTSMNRLPPDAPASGYAKTSQDFVVDYVTFLAPGYDDERAMFPRYIEALQNHRYMTLRGMTKSLFANITSIRSAMGGVDFGPDWWDTQQSSVDMAGEVVFTGVSIDSSLMARNYSDMMMFLGLDPANPVLNSTMIDLLIPRSAIPKRRQVAGLMYKMFSTDPEKLDSFTIHVGKDAWLQNLGALDVKSTAKCQLLEHPSITYFNDIRGGFWCPRDYYPSIAYLGRFVNGTVGNWVIECDTPPMEMTIEVIRWNARLAQRYSTAFYHNAVRMTAPRKTMYTQKMLLNLTNYISGSVFRLQDIVTVASSGTLEPLPSTIYIVQTDQLPDALRTAVLLLGFVTIAYTRCTLMGVRTLFHFMLESPLAIVMNVAYALLTYPSGTELAVMLLTARSVNSISIFLRLFMLLRPYSIPALIIAKALMSVRYGYQQVTRYVTVKESVIPLLFQIVLLRATAADLVGVGMHKGTTSDAMTSFSWIFHGESWVIVIVFIFLRFHAGHAIERRERRHQIPEESTDELAQLPAYDKYLGGKFFAFDVCFLPEVRIGTRRCRVIEGGPLWMDAVFNFNMNGLVQYNQVIDSGTLTRVSLAGKYTRTDIALVKHEHDTGHVIVG